MWSDHNKLNFPRDAALGTLQTIHKAGILHGDISSANLLLGPQGLTIVDFSHSSICNSHQTKEAEYKTLQRLLDLEVVHNDSR